MSDRNALLTKPEFPRSQGYDPDLVLDNQMGPNPLWLLEWLTEELRIEPEMRILDLGCGRALTSIFLAKEFRARVWAADLWIDPEQNWQRVREAGVDDRVCPLRCEAHALPFAKGFFDAVVSIDAFHYFGTDVLYLSYLSAFVRERGRLGVVGPGLTSDFSGGIPRYLTEPRASGKGFWEPECYAYRTKEFWTELWGCCGEVTEVRGASMPEGWRHWRDFELARDGKGGPSEAEVLEKDAGKHLGFVRVVGRRNAVGSPGYYGR